MECSICLEKIEEEKKTLKCDHEFHTECINLWLNEKKECPVCRTAVETNEQRVVTLEETSETVRVQSMTIPESILLMTSFMSITLSFIVTRQSELFLLFPLYSFICLIYTCRKVHVHIIKVLGIYIILSFILNFSLYNLSRKRYNYILMFSIFVVQTIIVEIVSKKRNIENN